MIRSGCLPHLIRFLTVAENPKLQFEAAWAITNVASGESAHTQALVDNGAVVPLIALLGAPNWDIREQAVWALGNIAGDGAGCRDYVLTMGVLPALLQMITAAAQTPQLQATLMRNSAWTLSNLFRGKPSPPLNMVAPGLPMIAALLQHPDQEVVVDVLWAVSYATDGGEDRVQAVLDAGLFQTVVDYLSSSDPTKQMPALRSVGNVLTGSHGHTQAVLDMGALPRLVALLGSSKRTLRKEACWALSNIAAGTKEQIQMLIKSGAVPLVREIVKSSDFDLKKEAAWVLANSCSCGTPEQIRMLVSQANIIQPLCDVLTLQDTKLLKTVLDALENILRVGASSGGTNNYALLVEEADGLTKIEALESHANAQIYERAVRIIEDYFDGTAVDDELISEGVMSTTTAPAAPVAGHPLPTQPATFSFAAPAAGAPPGGFYFS